VPSSRREKHYRLNIPSVHHFVLPFTLLIVASSLRVVSRNGRGYIFSSSHARCG
jgi:hypothetical protein